LRTDIYYPTQHPDTVSNLTDLAGFGGSSSPSRGRGTRGCHHQLPLRVLHRL